ncbi:hypothetical protein, partial [Aeromonas salmonicida]|uniref:hypothetical protein n=1 Tax=Aeromonas salmonicida TaxID=645 RepID=UPI003D30F532
LLLAIVVLRLLAFLLLVARYLVAVSFSLLSLPSSSRLFFFLFFPFFFLFLTRPPTSKLHQSRRQRDMCIGERDY